MSQHNEAAGTGPAWSPTSPAGPAGGPRGGAWFGPTGLALGAGMLVIVALVRVIVGFPKVSQSYYQALYSFESAPVVWIVLGLLMIASIVPIAFAVVLGHVGVSRAKATGTSAAVSGIALGIGYTLVVFWVVRLVNAIANAAEFNGGFRMFIEYVGLWA
ncbi:hypothetical protein [Nocardioides sp. YR527]|uniref:hypothetical protein n=1 Tax=Nocardioides sp. YR527 TaxID=1881028 RepID=UPI00115F951C|nr:hypothetical protein [Nocardioides sp. YR527]